MNVYMEMFPVITKNKQELYEKIFCDNEKLQNEIPSICGYYGRGCRRMNRPSNGMPCLNCSLRIFALACEAIKEQCDDRESLGIDYLYDSDILEIQEILESNHIHVNPSYIETILESLANIEE